MLKVIENKLKEEIALTLQNFLNELVQILFLDNIH